MIATDSKLVGWTDNTRVRVAKTIQPLHFEDLEPHRFEDLVRQLIYDFRHWLSLEAVGRSGADEGVDILAIEGDSQELDVDDEPTSLPTGRTWIVQCKGEKRVTPRLAARYVHASLQGKQNIYGFILATTADLSNRAREAFRAAARDVGVNEAHIWSRAELEDLLFLPQHDHLLFAYFGVSLQVQRRSRRAQLASDIALKRKLVAAVPLHAGAFHRVLVRDPAATDYPFIRDWRAFREAPSWRYYEITGHFPPRHLQIVAREIVGWHDAATGEWDIPNVPTLWSSNHELHGLPHEIWEAEEEERASATERIPADKRATIRVYRYVSYDQILAVDDIGDAYNEGPHLLVSRNPESGFFVPNMYTFTVPRQFQQDLRLDEDKHIDFFQPSSA